MGSTSEHFVEQSDYELHHNKTLYFRLGVVIHAFNTSTCEAEADVFL